MIEMRIWYFPANRLKDIPRPQNIQCDAERPIKPDLICPRRSPGQGAGHLFAPGFLISNNPQRGFKRTDRAELMENPAKQDFAKRWEKSTSILVFLHWSNKTKNFICDTRTISSKAAGRFSFLSIHGHPGEAK
jgi:hypothetical protein